MTVVTGNIRTMTNGATSLGRVRFHLSAPAWVAATGNIYAPEFVEAVGNTTTGAFSIDLEPTTGMTGDRVYFAVLHYRDTITNQNMTFVLGRFALTGSSPVELSDILVAGPYTPIAEDALALAQASAASAASNAALADADRIAAQAAAASINIIQVADLSALAALNTAQYKAAYVDDNMWEFRSGNQSAFITAGDSRYVAPASAPTGASGAWFKGIQGSVQSYPARTTGARFELQKTIAAPLNYNSSRNIFVLQWEDDNDGATVANGLKLNNIEYVLRDNIHGQTTSATNSSVITSQGIRVDLRKGMDGSAHAFTVSGALLANGLDNGRPSAFGYNEFGCFQANVSNQGSSGGNLSGLEVHLKDSPDDGVTSFPTRFGGAIVGIEKYNTSTRPSYAFFAVNEGLTGSQDIDAAFYIETRGFGGFTRGINLFGTGAGIDFGTLVAIDMKENNKIRWRDNAGNRSDLYANANSHFVFDSSGNAQVFQNFVGTSAVAAYSFVGRPNCGLSSVAADTVSLIGGGVEGIRITATQVQLAIAGTALRNLSVGAVDSGGAGFRVVRVPNT